MDDILFALWFFLPAGLANVTPIFASKLPILSEMNAPMDFGVKFRGKPLLGTHKTIRGIVSGTFIGSWVFYLQAQIGGTTGGLDYSELTLWLGVLLAFGALFGDMVKSFAKRQFNVTSGRSWFPFDQLDYILGGLLLSSFVITLSFKQYILIIIVWFVMHLLSSYVGYLTKFKKDPI